MRFFNWSGNNFKFISGLTVNAMMSMLALSITSDLHPVLKATALVFTAAGVTSIRKKFTARDDHYEFENPLAFDAGVITSLVENLASLAVKVVDPYTAAICLHGATIAQQSIELCRNYNDLKEFNKSFGR